MKKLKAAASKGKSSINAGSTGSATDTLAEISTFQNSTVSTVKKLFAQMLVDEVASLKAKQSGGFVATTNQGSAT